MSRHLRAWLIFDVSQKTMLHRALYLIAVLAAQTAIANPSILVHQAYIESEDLEISIDDDTASFVGNFVFRSAPYAPGHSEDGAAVIQVPIWIPANCSDDKSALGRFLAMFPTNRLAWIKNDTKPLVDEVVGLTIKVSDKEVPYETFSPCAYGERSFPRAWARQDVRCLIFREFFDRSALRDGAKISLTYHQPLVRVGEKRMLFYVPIFRNLSYEEWRKHAKDYRIVVKCSSGEVLRATSELLYHTQPREDRLVIRPENEQAIEIDIEKKANKTPEPTPTAITPPAGQEARQP
jgi:hypothetical protein